MAKLTPTEFDAEFKKKFAEFVDKLRGELYPRQIIDTYTRKVLNYVYHVEFLIFDPRFGTIGQQETKTIMYNPKTGEYMYKDSSEYPKPEKVL